VALTLRYALKYVGVARTLRYTLWQYVGVARTLPYTLWQYMGVALTPQNVHHGSIWVGCVQ
jgi:hypothetical protein